MATRTSSLTRNLSADDPYVFACLIAIIAWLVPQAYVGEYQPIMLANDLPTLTWLGGYVIAGTGAIFVTATAIGYLRGQRRLWAPAIIAAIALAYYVFWRERSLWAPNDEYKLVWGYTGTFGTRALAIASAALIVIRMAQSGRSQG